MNGRLGRCCLLVWGLLSGSAAAEMADVYLKNGTALRGDVELSEHEMVLRNIAGEVRYERRRVDRIEWLEPAESVQQDYLRRLWGLTPNDVEEHFALAQWLFEQGQFDLVRERCRAVLELDPRHRDALELLDEVAELLEQRASPNGEELDAAATAESEGPVETGAREGISPAPPLSPRDILKLKLSEIALDDPPERLDVRFRKVEGQPDLMDLVSQQMADAFDYDPDWWRVLEEGWSYERLLIVLKATGLKYVDRIELRGHPKVFREYRRRVLPLVVRGCLKGGCHAGPAAHVFRFPAQSRTTEGFIYTSFILLDQMETSAGPMIDRTLPEASGLVRYLCPAQQGQKAHPLVKDRPITPILRGVQDPRHQAILEWISSLRSPHPDYQLEYEFPKWFEPLSRRAKESAVAEEPESPTNESVDDAGQQEEPPSEPHTSGD